MNKLTGRTRYRLQNRLFGKPLVVLQVEFEDDHGFFEGQRFKWRDATFEDITEGMV